MPPGPRSSPWHTDRKLRTQRNSLLTFSSLLKKSIQSHLHASYPTQGRADLMALWRKIYLSSCAGIFSACQPSKSIANPEYVHARTRPSAQHIVGAHKYWLCAMNVSYSWKVNDDALILHSKIKQWIELCQFYIFLLSVILKVLVILMW